MAGTATCAVTAMEASSQNGAANNRRGQRGKRFMGYPSCNVNLFESLLCAVFVLVRCSSERGGILPNDSTCHAPEDARCEVPHTLNHAGVGWQAILFVLCVLMLDKILGEQKDKNNSRSLRDDKQKDRQLQKRNAGVPPLRSSMKPSYFGRDDELFGLGGKPHLRCEMWGTRIGGD